MDSVTALDRYVSYLLYIHCLCRATSFTRFCCRWPSFCVPSLNVRFFSCRLIYGVCLFGASVCNMSDSHLLTYSGLGGVPL